MNVQQYNKASRILTRTRDELMDLRTKRTFFRRLSAIVADNPNTNRQSQFFTWVNDLYVCYVSMSIRRLSDESKGASMSLGALLTYLEQNPGLVQMSTEALSTDKEQVHNVTLKVRAWTDRVYAHADPHQEIPEIETPSIRDIDSCIDLITELVRKYQGHLGDTMDLDFSTDGRWTEIFRHPWLQPKSKRAAPKKR